MLITLINQLKWAIDQMRYFSNKTGKWATDLWKNMCNNIDQQKSANQNHHDILFYPSKKDNYKTEKETHKNKTKINHKICAGEYIKKGEFLHPIEM